jgi:outer membrane protein assembly factor BamB
MTDRPSRDPIRLRIWPAVFIVLLYLAVTGAALLFASSDFHHLIGFAISPLLATLLLALWWLTASRAPVRDRLIGFALAAAIMLGIVLAQEASGYLLLMIAMPGITSAVAAVLLVTPRMSWPRRRRLVVVLMLAIGAAFLCVRVEGMTGRLLPAMSWRWTPKAEELLAAPELDSAGPGEVAQLPAELSDHDWPGFRGPARDGCVVNTRFATNWIEHPPRELWRRPVGLGWSSFAVVGDYVFTQEQRGDHEVVVCYRIGSGGEVWINRLPVRFEDNTGSGPRATPTYHEGRLFTLGATGVLQCLDASSGATRWKRNLVQDTGAKVPEWGFTSSPLVVGDSVTSGLVTVFLGAGSGKGVAAYDCLSGERKWLAGEGSHGYSSPHSAHIGGVPQILMTSDFGLQSFAPESGDLLWQHEWDLDGRPRIVQPLVLHPDRVMFGSSYGKGSRLLSLQETETSWDVKELWTSRRLKSHFNDLVFHGGCCYGFDGTRLTCIDAATGQRQWNGARYGGQVLLIRDIDTLLVLSEAGAVVLVQATPEQANQVARIQALHSKTWNHPVIARGKLLVRNAEEAVCYELP